MKTIIVVNEKGGVGKTTVATTLAAGLAVRGRRVMLVDADPQGHSTTRFGLPKSPGIYDLLVRDANWADVAKRVAGERFGMPGEAMPQGRLFVLPSNVETRNIAGSFSDADRFSMRLRELETLRTEIDIVIIDTSPTPSLLHGILYLASDAVLYPTTLTYDAFDGLEEAISHRINADEKRQNQWGMRPIRVLGVVPVAYRKGTLEQDGNLAKLRNNLVKKYNLPIWEPLPIATIWTETERLKIPVWSIDETSSAAGDAWYLVDQLEGQLYGTQTLRYG